MKVMSLSCWQQRDMILPGPLKSSREYALNRTIDKTLSALDSAGLRALLDAAKVPRAARLVQVAKDTVREAKARWPRLLRDAPDNVRASIESRLAGAVALARD
jgi:serine/threonine-protein kinase HipA